MLRLSKEARQNVGILAVVLIFLALGIATNAESAQTKSAKKATPTPKKTAAKTPTPKPNSKTTAKSKTPDKNDKKTKASDKNSKTTAATSKKLVDNKKTTAKNSAKSSDKTTGKSNSKAPEKTSSKSSSSSKNASSKNSSTKNASTAKSTAKPPVVQKTVTKTPVKSTAKNTAPVSQPTTATRTRELSKAIVTVTSARVRNQPSATASEVKRLRLGTQLKVLDENPTWYKIELSSSPKQTTGWVSKQVASDFDESSREDTYRRIVDRNYKNDKMSFADAAEVYEFLTDAQDEVKNQNLSADVGFKRLLALRAALKAVPFGKGESKPYSDFLKKNEKVIVYSEPSGEWYVRSEAIWDLRKKMSNAPNAEEIAWAASQNPLPGECEGYVNCYLFLLRETDGEYLNLYPSGKYAEQSLKNIQSLLDPIVSDSAQKQIYTGPTDVSDRAEFNKLIAELRTIVSKLPFGELEKQKTIRQMNQIAEAYR